MRQGITFLLALESPIISFAFVFLSWFLRAYVPPMYKFLLFVEHALRRAFLCNRLQSALSTSDRTPAAILRPVWACTLKGCRIKPRREPPIRALAPMP
jgi:hypothetical protein